MSSEEGAADTKAYGSGYFGEWITDSFGLPAYRYTCNQISDPKAITPVHPQWRGPIDQTHQVGNDRLVAAVSNYGYLQVRQDEGSPKFLNDYFPEQNRYGAGIGFLTDGKSVLSTYYPGGAASFERIFGEGYFRKIAKSGSYEIDQVIFAPFGQDPVLVSQVSLTNRGSDAAQLRWVEYWGCLNYQFSYRSWMQATISGSVPLGAELRRRFGSRFAHHFRIAAADHGLIETQEFLGRAKEDEDSWAKVEAYLKANPTDFFGGPVPPFPPHVAMEDLAPPPTFLASLDAPMDGFSTDANAFFGSGGIANPSGLANPLSRDRSATGPESAFLIERNLLLKPGETRSLHFLYGYLPEGFEAGSLIKKYRETTGSLWPSSSVKWKTLGIRFRVPSEPWAERETCWHHYYLRSNLTYDSFFNEHILSQGHVYQYIMGFQGAARDPLQHVLPFVFSDPDRVRQVIRYTLKEIQPDGSIPYGIVGCGVPMPAVFRPSDLEMWLLWVASEYVLATRDKDFLNERIPLYPQQTAISGSPSVRELLHRSYLHLVDTIGVGKHGLMRLSNGDWNDDIVVGHVPPSQSAVVKEQGESVLNAAMASYVLRYYGTLLTYIGDEKTAAEARAKAEGQLQAVRAQWTGSWFRRAWFGPKLGWLGDEQFWLEPQPWAIIGGATTPEQKKKLTDSINRDLRQPSPIGAMLINKGDDTMRMPAGVLTNGGVWPSINGTLIWALALADGKAAWDEWKKNCLALHAEAYPDVWYGIWSGPDTYNSVLSRYPGQTMFAEKPSASYKTQPDWGFNWTDYPVMNMHPHAWPLYSAAKLLGLEFHETGLRLEPALPLDEYEFTSPLLGFQKSSNRYSGWYAPSVAGRWQIDLKLPGEELVKLQQLKVNGKTVPIAGASGAIRIEGETKPEAPLQWKIS
ncbi:MAG TPA: hypothetical protein VMU43_11445 [Candidatus Acidoferrum sp.]|nr:hypothetical protein [Candidatus Acidoferrum sp.]